MKNNTLFFLIISLLFFASCKKETQLTGPDRLFRPVLKTALQSDANWIIASWQPIKNAVSYTIELSRDSFKTIDASIVSDTNYYKFDNLKWEQLYQLQVRANAENADQNSKFSDLGGIKTPRFPTILSIPGIADIADNAVKVSWANSGATVTNVKILNAADSSVAKNIALSATDVTNAYKIVSGLQASAKYIIFLYSSTTVRGWANFTTKAALSGNIVDLRDISGVPTILADTIPDVPSGSTILLKRGELYTISSAINIDRSVTILSGTDLLIPDKAKIFMTSNFNFTAGATIDSLVFNDVYMYSDNYGSRYIFNTTNGATVGSIKFLNSRIEIFRGVLRLQSGTSTVSNFVIDKCIVDSIAGYGVLTVGVATCKADNISFTNSTFYKAEKLIASVQNSTSLLIENCTMNEVPSGGNYYIDYGSLNVTNPAVLKNSILGIGKSNAGNRQVRTYRFGAATSVDASGNYGTFDRSFTGTDFNITTYSRSSTEIWKDPLNGDFTIIDNLYPGKSNTGDPRWRL